MSGELRLWFWTYTDDFGRRRRSTWRMGEEAAKHYKDSVKIESTLEVRNPSAGIGASHICEPWKEPK